MTDRQKIEAIKKETSVLAEELTAEEAAFLDREWNERSEEEKRLFYTAWKEEPDTIEHAAHHTGRKPAELKVAASVIRSIRDKWIAAADTAENEFQHILASELLEVLDRAAADAQEAAEAQQPQQLIKACPFCGGYVHTDRSASYFRNNMLYCEGCDMYFALDSIYKGMDDLIAAYNRRSEGGEATAEE